MNMDELMVMVIQGATKPLAPILYVGAIVALVVFLITKRSKLSMFIATLVMIANIIK